jgi:DNA-binding transcriptional regulator YdaS (Cro superfamily)
METSTPLAAYLARTGQSFTDFAAAVGAHRSQIHRIAAGERGAGALLALAIEKETKGAVSAASVSKRRTSKRARRGARRSATA